ncbi:MAG: hypothetical protein JXQ90_23705 [Cyclobacteriaceae bacterium]
MTFDIKRFWKLIQLEVFRNRRGIIMAMVICFGFMFSMGIILENLVESIKIYDSFPTGYAFSLMIVGFVLTSMAFPDLSTTLKRHGYLTLPVSTLERFLSMWLLTTFGWIVIYTIEYYAYTIIASQIGSILFRHVTFIAFDPFSPFVLQVIMYYIIIQSIFLVGATQFKGYVFPKTLFTIILFSGLCGLIMYYTSKEFSNVDEGLFDGGMAFEGMPSWNFWLFAKTFFYWLLAPLCWIISYLGLKDMEI